MRKGTRLSPSLTVVVVVRGESLGTRLTFHPDTVTDLPALAMDDSELRQFIEGQANSNTKKKIRSDMNAWKRFSECISESRTMECIPAEELDRLLAHFYVSTRKQDGVEYEPDTLTSFQWSFARCYMQYYPHIVDMHVHTHSTLFLPIQVFEGQTLST